MACVQISSTGRFLRAQKVRCRASSVKLCRPVPGLVGFDAPQRRGIAGSRLSYVEGPSEPPLLRHTVPEHFASIVSRYGDQPAVMSRAPTTRDILPAKVSLMKEQPETTILTYEKLDTLSNTLAHSLRSLGVKKGDRVVVSLGNVAENAALTYAIFKLGAILVPLNPAFTSTQLTTALSHLEAEVLIIAAFTDQAYKPCSGRNNLEILRILVPNLEGKVESPDVPTLKTVILVDNTGSHPEAGFPPVERLSALTPYEMLTSNLITSVTPDTPLNADETINIQFTSGTTSVPKAAMLSHTSILNNGALVASRMGLTSSDRMVVPPPLFHCFGCVLGYMATATTGAAILFPSPAFDPAATLRMVTEQRATGLYGVATMFVAELELMMNNTSFISRTPKNAFRGLRKGIAAGSSMPENLMNKIHDKLGIQDLVICYGMTETSPVSVMTSPDDPLKKRTSTIGKVMPHTAVKIVNPTDRTKTVPVGEKGELAASGYLVMKGYYGDEARTAEDRITDEDGRVWMYSGDEAVLDDEGYISITGRIKDLIVRGGENIHPLEVENCLFKMPGVQEVSVVGVPDEKYGEVVGAFIVPQTGWKIAEEEQNSELAAVRRKKAWSSWIKKLSHSSLSKKRVRNWVKDRLSRHLAPKYVWWVDEYPKTASGKIQKYKLREMAVEDVKKWKEEQEEDSE